MSWLIWPEHHDRRHRLLAALNVAADSWIRIDREDLPTRIKTSMAGARRIHEVVVKRVGAQRILAQQAETTGSATSSSTDTEVCSDTECHASHHLVVPDWKDRTLMAMTAPSMG
ncbi:DUF2332 family protein [Mycolicibacterium sp. P1-18]|uniref:DUF2332 family protein n=1 Tax=Mycolicibacterium sp. P1-18 TaxID=2024615 RepID=UPI0011F32108|nr:DUF2332 family protein [Mycolicibacterium sp. P1-18]KAA0099688.1 DUF2332 family protein [Mycolicibacterium sp. P1-18]